MRESNGARLRERVARGGLLQLPSCPDPFTARIAEDAGFEAVALGGYAMGAGTTITEPLLTMSEVVESSRRIVQAVDIPLVVDGGAGFGDPMHTMRTVRELEGVGVAAVHIEDQIFPKRAHYHREYREHIIPAEEMATKISYATRARRDPGFVVIARTDAMQTDGYQEGVRRANLYADAGADMVMIFPKTLEEATNAPRDCKAPLIYVNSTGNRTQRPILTSRQLADLGYAACMDAISVVITQYLAVRDLMASLRRSGRADLDDAAAREARLQIERLIGLETYYRIEEETVERQRA
jgi:2-methylisocitrate lyase-like PEP mutase family enzyme